MKGSALYSVKLSSNNNWFDMAGSALASGTETVSVPLYA